MIYLTAKYNVIESISATVTTSSLFDTDITTCHDAHAALTEDGHYRIDMTTAFVTNDVIVRVYFNDTIHCGKRKVSLVHHHYCYMLRKDNEWMNHIPDTK